ncbi:MAG: hypothetical protein V5A43_06840 [Haloarculaceae archaeon]
MSRRTSAASERLSRPREQVGTRPVSVPPAWSPGRTAPVRLTRRRRSAINVFQGQHVLRILRAVLAIAILNEVVSAAIRRTGR